MIKILITFLFIYAFSFSANTNLHPANSMREKYLESIQGILELTQKQQHDIALSKSEPLSSEFPSFPEAFTISGDCLFQLGSFEESYKAYLKSLYLESNSHIYDRAKEALKKIDNMKLIIIKLKRIINDKPNDFIMKNILTSFYIDLEMFDKAIIESQEVLNINPWDSEALTNLALSYLHKGEPVQSRKYIDMAFSQNIKSDKLLFLKGFLLIQSDGNVKEGEKELINAIKANPFVPVYYYNLASLYIKLKLYNKASALLKQASEIDPTNVKIFLALARSYYLNNKTTKSLETFQRIIQFAPTSASGYLGLGKLYLKLNQYNKTLTYFNTAIKFDNSQISLLSILEVYFQKYFYLILLFCLSSFVLIFFILKKYYEQSPKF